MLLSYLHVHSRLDSLVWKIWPTNCYAYATRLLSANAGHTTSYNARKSSVSARRVDTTTRGLNTRIQRLLASGLRLYRTPRPSTVLWTTMSITSTRLGL